MTAQQIGTEREGNAGSPRQLANGCLQRDFVNLEAGWATQESGAVLLASVLRLGDWRLGREEANEDDPICGGHRATSIVLPTVHRAPTT